MGRTSSAELTPDFRTRQVQVNTSTGVLQTGMGYYSIPDTIAIHLPGLDAPVEFQNQDEIVLGRGESVSLSLPDFDPCLSPDVPMVSRQHAVIRKTEFGFTLEDLNSTNGTWVNGMELQPGQVYLLRNGDQVKLAEQLLFVYFATEEADAPVQ